MNRNILEGNISIKFNTFDRVSLRTMSDWTVITESEESRVCTIFVRRSDLIRFRQEKERPPSALDKGTVRKIDNKIKISGKNFFIHLWRNEPESLPWFWSFLILCDDTSDRFRLRVHSFRRFHNGSSQGQKEPLRQQPRTKHGQNDQFGQKWILLYFGQ